MKQSNVKERIFVIKLIDGIERNINHPTTFHIPSENFINNHLKIGSVVKIGDLDYSERFWVKVLEFMDNNIMICEIQNNLYSNQPYDYLDKILVERKNILGFEFFNCEEELDEKQNDELFLENENKWKDWEYCELLSNSNNINLN